MRRQSRDLRGFTHMELREITATRYVTPLREGGSLPALVEADDDGLYVLKFRGAGQGEKALVAEVVAGELARALGFAVPELAVVRLDPAIGRAEPDPEIQDLLLASAGPNLGVDFLPGALPFRPPAGPVPAAARAADIVWFDALVTNIDRTAKNTNMLHWHGRLWLIDHGAALYFHHGDADPAEHARRPFEAIEEHVLLPFAGSIREADERLRPTVTRELLEVISAAIPAAWLDDRDSRIYADYLRARLESPRAFVEEAEEARDRR
jgi:HipA-like kinase